jgi:hypothetical protein
VPSLSCFVHPADDFAPRELTDTCPVCGRPYGFPLDQAPTEIDSFTVDGVLGRGFYAATYEATTGRLGDKVVLKVAPVAVYEHFRKDFETECRLHKEVADGTEHLVAIRDMFDTEVRFGDTTVLCHVAVLEFVSGVSLRSFTSDPALCTATSMAQVAIDLFRLLHELAQKQVFHNDLHDENIIIQLVPPNVRRPDTVDDTIRAVAVDLGSMARHDRRDPHHLGDLQAVVRHLFTLIGGLLDRPGQVADVDYRLAAALEEIGHGLAPEAEKVRTPDHEESIRRIRAVFEYVTSPWKEPAGLQRFDDAYNAQTLHPWFVPRLLVDPDGQWLDSVSVRGPQVITGMRGCGKTMLLRSLQFHARAFNLERQGGDVADLLHADGFLGLYVSCTRLLDALGSESDALHEPYARLFAAYAREAIRAVGHLREIEAGLGITLAAPDAHRRLGRICAEYLADAAELATTDGERALEESLQRILMSLDRGEARHRLMVNPTIAFPQLAETLAGCAEVWSGSLVLFLLDDVSTRHLNEQAITDLLSTLLFSDPLCAFKMTTELQTLELVLRSPGRIERARAGRDYNLFDLGAAVNAKLRDHKSKNKGKQFVADVLAHRAEQYRLHPLVSPAEFLGDATLESIARTIASTTSSSRSKKAAYHGLTALTAMCVGDIGDVISVYELIMRKAQARNETQAEPVTQSECMQEYCSRRLYNVSRRDGRLKDFALGFAAASHELLVRSHRDAQRTGIGRLRQYNSVYVRLTAEDTDEQYRQLRDLVDAGVFVLEGGPDSPRTKSRDRDPVQQFVLTYRKLFGLSSFIGLAERDRFELSGQDLDEWLTHPDRGREVLMRNLGGPLSDEDRYETPESDATGASASREQDMTRTRSGDQLGFDLEADDSVELIEVPEDPGAVLVANESPRAPTERPLSPQEVAELAPTVIVLGLGFEDRALESAVRLLAATEPARAILVRYPEPGHGAAIEDSVRSRVPDVRVVDYEALQRGEPLGLMGGLAAVDITGLAKPALFAAVREGLEKESRVVVAHTRAETYYPLDADIDRALQAAASRDVFALLDSLSTIWPGERGPYRFVRLLPATTDDSRRRALCAAASPKHERLLSLLGEREYDTVSLIAPVSATPRSQLARLAAQVALAEAQHAAPDLLGSDDLASQLSCISRLYQHWYVARKFSFELGLTGSKMHAVACAAASVAFKVSECWYVAPREFDPATFSLGVGATSFHEVRLGPGR